MHTAQPTDQSESQVPLPELALAFLKLGTSAFGGPAAHIAMMQDEFVRKRRWITEADFLDRLAAANLIPGPSSTEVAIFIGQSKRGWPGLVVAGCCFILPAAILVTMIAAAYARFGTLPQVNGILYGIKPAVIAIVLQAVWSLSRTAAKTTFLALLGGTALALSLVGVSPLPVLVFSGLASAIRWSIRNRAPAALSFAPFAAPAGVSAGTVALSASVLPAGLLRLFLSFLKIGAVVFGSGYVLLAFLRTEFVDQLHWLTEKQLIDAVAVGQFTPGPVFTTATFIGYLVAGPWGAALATIGIFLPGFILVALSGPLLPKLRRSPLAAAVLDGIVAGSLGLIAAVAWQLGRAAVIDAPTLAILLASLFLLLRYRINSAWLVGGAALAGLLLSW